MANQSIYNAFQQFWTHVLTKVGVGKNVTGIEYTIDDVAVTAGTGAEVFNNYENNIASGNYSHAEGYYTRASGGYSHAEGWGSKAKGFISHAEGVSTASGDYSHSECYENTASGKAAHAEGWGNEALGETAHAEGYNTTASGNWSHAEGVNAIASGTASHAEGYYTTALDYQHVQGHYNKISTATAGNVEGTTGTAFVIGCGTSSSTANAFRVDYSGAAYGLSSFNSSGADYAEYFEWLDGNPDNEDRRGYFVTIDGEKIKFATPGDYILGIISALPAVIGNGDEDWQGKFLHDEFGDFIPEEIAYTEEKTIQQLNAEGVLEDRKVTVTKHTMGYKVNPDYNPDETYVSRADRPEWDAVGMMGVLAVRDDGTCEVNGFCEVADGGIATASESGYRVIKRVSDNIVKVVFK